MPWRFLSFARVPTGPTTRYSKGLSRRVVLLCLAALLLTGCNTLGYYAQSISGQWELLRKRTAIETLLAAATTPEDLRARLLQAREMRRFASRELALPDNGSYRSYADLGRPFVVWNVFAAPRYDMTLQQWCFPVAGCVSYRGYFTEQAAREFARQLASEGQDTWVGGVAAYSTLGWFDDPLLNTVIERPPPRLAGLMFHELAHQQLYVADDTAFNEAFATTVELEGVNRWLAAAATAEERAAHGLYLQRQAQFVALVTDARHALAVAYAQGGDDATLAQRKQQLFADLREQYQLRKQHWGGYAGYDAWFGDDLNNAKLAAVMSYQELVPALQALLSREGGDLPAFYRRCAALAGLSVAERRDTLARLAAAPVTVAQD